MHPYCHVFDEYIDDYGQRRTFSTKKGKCGFAPSIVTEHYGVNKVDNVKPSRSKVEIEDLGCDLLSGVRILSLERKVVHESKPPSWPQVFYSHLEEKHWIDDIPGLFQLTVDSYIKEEDHSKVEPAEVWLPFIAQDVEYCALKEAHWVKHDGKKYRKLAQKFLVKLQEPEEGAPAVPYLQFLCKPKAVRHSGSNFKNGDIITIVVKHPKYPILWPSPPIITVIPTEAQHYVPMLPRQRMVIVTRAESASVDFKAHANSNIEFEGTMPADFGRECSYFHCKKPSSSSEVIFVNQKKKKKENRKVIIPCVEKEVRYPVILNPLKDSVIHAQNIEGFVVRFLKDACHPIIVSGKTPIRHVFTNENAQYIERRFEIDKKRPFFYLRKQDHSWIIE